MLDFLGVSLGKTLSDVSFRFDGASLCIITSNGDEARAVTDLICGLRTESSGAIKNTYGRIPLVSASLPAFLTADQLLDSVSAAAGCPLSAYSQQSYEKYSDCLIGRLSSTEKAEVALAELFACEAEAVIADRVSEGLFKNERVSLIERLSEHGKETDTAVIYTSVSAAEMEKSEFVLAIWEGKTLYFGKTEDFIKLASEQSPVAVSVMGDSSKADAFFKKLGAEAETGVKKNTFKATCPAGTDIELLKKSVRAAGLTLLSAKTLDNNAAKLYTLLKHTDSTLDEQFEDYKEEHAAPRKLELSDFAFNRDDEDEEDDE